MEKEQKRPLEEEVVNKPCERNINIVVEKHVSLENIHSGVVVNDELPLISFQIVEQIEVIPEVVLPEVSKLVDSVMNMRLGDQTQFS